MNKFILNFNSQTDSSILDLLQKINNQNRCGSNIFDTAMPKLKIFIYSLEIIKPANNK